MTACTGRRRGRGDDTTSTTTRRGEEDGVPLQASWSDGEVVVWAGGPRSAPASNDELADRLEAIGGPALGWRLHRGVPLPAGRAEAVSIPVADALGWLVAVGGGLDGDGVGASVRGSAASRSPRCGWSPGSGRPDAAGDQARRPRRRHGRAVEARAARRRRRSTGWRRPCPGPVASLAPPSVASRTLVVEVLGAVVHAIVDAGGRAARAAGAAAEGAHRRRRRRGRDHPARRFDVHGAPAGAAPRSRAARAVGEAGHQLARGHASSCSSTRPTAATRGSCRCSAPARNAGSSTSRSRCPRQSTRPVADELARLERLLPVLQRPGALRRGQVYLSTDEAWELMTRTGESLEAAGFDVRVPALSRRKPKPGLRLFVEPSGDTVVGAHQLSNVRWSVVFDDVELTAAEVARLADRGPAARAVARTWVELDRVDLKEAAAALAERAHDDAAHRRRDPPPRRRPRRLAARRAHCWSTAAAGPPTCSRRPRRSPRGGHRARGLRRRAAQLPGRGARVARVPRCRRARRLPRARHGPRQDADGARPPRPHRRRTGPRWSSPRPRSSATGPRRRRGSRPSLRVVIHHGAVARVGRASSPARSPAPTWSSRPTAPPCATSRRWPRCRGTG